MSLKLSLFGTFELLDKQIPVTKFRADKVRALLAFLSVETNRAHQRPTLATILWSESSDAAALKNLRTSLSNLRTCLGDDALLTATRQHIQLVSGDALFVDVLEFERLMVACEVHEHADIKQCEPCISRMQKAIELYKGEFLLGLSVTEGEGFSEWQTIQRESLHNQAINALQILITYASQQEDPARLQRVAQRLLALSPWSEVAHRALMMALAQRGDRASALRQYEQCERVLWDELGVEPEAETQALAEQIKNRELTFTKASPRPKQAQHNLPRQLSPLIGRSAEFKQLTSAITDNNYPLVTLIGAGGMGKTRLALEVAHGLLTHFEDGVWFVDLQGIDANVSAVKLVHLIASQLKLELNSDEDPLKQIAAALRPKRQLIVLDNCEQLVENDHLIELLQALLAHTEHLQLLITSQQALELQSEVVVRLDGLSLPDSAESNPTESGSVQLFLERAQRISPQFRDAPGLLPSIVEVCKLVDGNPLALELAAASLRHSTLQQIVAQLRTNTIDLETSMRDIPKRHRKLRAVIEYAWQMLSAGEKRAVAQLSLFPSGFSSEAYAEVTQKSPVMLGTLVNKSLVQQTFSNDGSHRYRLLETVRHYSAEQAREQLDGDKLAQSQARHANYYLSLLADQTPHLRGNGQQQALSSIRREIDNVRLAWAYSLEQHNHALLSTALDAIHHFFDMVSWYAEGANTMATTAASADGVLRGKALAREGWFRFLLGEHARGQTQLVAGLQVLEDGGHSAETTFCHSYLSAIAMHLADYDSAMQHAKTALANAIDHHNQHAEMIARNLLGRIYFLQGEYNEAHAFYGEALTLAQQNGNRWSTAFSLDYLAQLAAKQDKTDEAQRLFARSLAIRQQLNDQRGIGLCYCELGDLAQQQGQNEDAGRLYIKALDTFSAVGNTRNINRTQHKLDLLAGH